MLMKSRILLLSAASLLALAGCQPKDKDAPKGAASANEAVAATVNGTPIRTRTIDQMVRQRAMQGQPDSAELRKSIIDNVALQMLVAEEAVKKGLDKVPENADQIDMIRQSVLAKAYVEDYFKNNPVTEETMKAEYEKVKAERAGNEYKARHILVAKEADAKDIIAKLKKNPKLFDALAKEKSMDPGSKERGGDLGWFDPHAMVPEFSGAIAKLEKGKMTEEPVKSNFGYHVILLEDSRPIAFPPMDQVREQLKQQVQQQNLKKFFDDVKAKAKIDVMPAPAAAGPAAPAGAHPALGAPAASAAAAGSASAAAAASAAPAASAK
ncbi:MAG: peptidylprolyl isomerase [Pseudomonadota bacterium]